MGWPPTARPVVVPLSTCPWANGVTWPDGGETNAAPGVSTRWMVTLKRVPVAKGMAPWGEAVPLAFGLMAGGVPLPPWAEGVTPVPAAGALGSAALRAKAVGC